jgi:hypothetical protein
MRSAGRVVPAASPIAKCDLAMLPGIRRGLDGDVEAFQACALPDGVGTTVTPSFEVFVAPEASLVHLVEVLGSAELTRIDRVIVARITKSSIRRAIGRGATLDTIVASLKRASRTPIDRAERWEHAHEPLSDGPCGSGRRYRACCREASLPS